MLEFAHDAPVVLLSPHFDDALLGCWALLADREQDLQVVNVFAGVPSEGVVSDWDLRVGLSRLDRLRGRDSAWLVAARAREDRDALAALGRVPVNLDFLDVQYRERGAPETSREVIAAELARRVPRASGVLLPAAIAPSAAATHRDHLLVRGLLGPLAVFGGPVQLYADLPYAARLGWPASVTPGAGTREAAEAWERALTDVGLRSESLTLRVRELSSVELERKQKALSRYRTQWKSLKLLRDELRFEVLLPVDQARAGS